MTPEQIPTVAEHEYENLRTSHRGKNTESLTGFGGFGYSIRFQDGDPAKYGVTGTTNEEILEHVLIPRLVSQNKLEHSDETSSAITFLEQALARLKKRAERKAAEKAK